MIDRSAAILRDALSTDPMAPNTLISLALTLHEAQRYWDEVKYLRQLITLLPTDSRILRLAVRVGIWGEDPALVDRF